MSESIRRKNSSRQLLENLIRVTAQRSQEDAEEVERERRRRSRERDRGEDSGPQDNCTEDTQLEEELKPSSSSSSSALEEDEGFGDWSHRMENRGEQEVSEEWRRRAQTCPTLQQKTETGGEEQQEDQKEEVKSQEASRRTAEVSSSKAKMSHSSAMFLPHGGELQPAAAQPADRSPEPVTVAMDPRGACRAEGQEERRERREEPGALQTQWRCEGTQRSDEDEEDLSLNQVSGESREGEEASRRSAESSRDEEAMTCYGPMSPTFKKLLIQFYPDEATSRVSPDGKCTIIERTESLKKSTHSVKRASLPVTVSKIDKRLEQYTHALEISSKENRSGTPVLTDLAAATEPVSSKKSLFEGGEAWNHNVTSVPPSKDADGLKVGVADLINQWVRGGEHGSQCSSPFKPADGSPWKRYRFVVTGHGKYEKVSVDGCEDTNCQSAQQFYEDL